VTRVLAAVFTALLAFPTTAFTETYPAHPSLEVNDYGTVLSDAEEAEIAVWLEVLAATKGVEFTVLTIDSMKEYGWKGEIEPYATRLFNAWGVGNAQRNDGILMLVAVDDRQMRIELGAGYAKSWDAKMQRVIDAEILPDFRSGSYATGIRDGVAHVIKDVTGAYPNGYGEPKDSKFMLFVKSTLIGAVLMLIIIFGKVRARFSSHRDNDHPSFGGGHSSGGGASGRW
jgi:uncharacterized protein